MIVAFFQALFSVVDMIIGLYIGIIFIEAIFSWMMAYDIISGKDKKMLQVQDLLNKLTAPFLDKIRKKVEKNTAKKDGEGNLEVKVSGSCDMVKNLLSAIGDKTRLEEGKSGRCVGYINLNDNAAEKFLASVRGK